MKRNSFLPSDVIGNVGALANKMDEPLALAKTKASGTLMFTEMWR